MVAIALTVCGYLIPQFITRSAEATVVLDAVRENRWPKLELLDTDTDFLPEEYSSNLAPVLEGGGGLKS